MAEGNQQFDTFDQWVARASSWLTRYEGKAICFDSRGRQCHMGREMMRARDENAFPVFWIWDWQVSGLRALAEKHSALSGAALVEAIDDTCEALVGVQTSEASPEQGA